MSDFKPDIWRLQTQFNTEGLLEALSHENAGIRKRAAAALRALGAYHTLPQLETSLSQETDPETRANLVAAIAILEEEKKRKESGEDSAPSRSTEVEHHIKALKQAQKPEELIKIAERLGELQNQSAVEPLLVIFNDLNKPVKVRLAVAESLLALEGATGEVALLGALRSDNWRVRRNGVAVLGQLRAVWAVEPLSNALLDKNELVRRTAFAALKNINTPEARQALSALRDAVLKKLQEKVDTQETIATPAKEETAPPAEEALETEEAETDDAGNRLVWPKRKEIPQELLPTRPLDPSILDGFDFGGGEDDE